MGEKVYGINHGEWLKCLRCGSEAIHVGLRWTHSQDECLDVLDSALRRARDAIRKTAEAIEDARLPAKWVVDHADRAHEYDRPYAVEALRGITAARDVLRAYGAGATR